jgi:hypothetical protein
MIEELRRRVAAKIRGAVLQKSPFPHLIVEDFLPADVYADVLRFNPFEAGVAGREWLPREASDNVTTRTPYFARKQVDLHDGVPVGGSPEARAFWSDLRTAFLDDFWFERLIVSRYEEYFVLRFGDLLGEPDFFALLRRELFVQRHERGFFIGPHTDIPTRVFTCIFSFADRPGYEEYGTQLLAHEDRFVRCFGNDHHAGEAFTVRALAPYRPNNAVLFFKTRQSFHAVPRVDRDIPRGRYGMQFQCHEPVGGVFRDLSTPALMHFRRERAR